MDDRKFAFELVKQIGSGQFSEVYKAKWLNAPLAPPCPPSPGVQSSLMGPLIDTTTSSNQMLMPPLSPGFFEQPAQVTNNTSGHHESDSKQVTGAAFSFDGTLNGNKMYHHHHHQPQQQHQQVGGQQQQQQGMLYGEKFVALKKIKFYDIQNSQQRMECIKEIRLLQQLNHPNIINYNISFEVRHELYIVLELADGGDIGKLIKYFQKKEKLINEQTILKYFTQICSAIRYIHSKRILHRDIKPANIFMTSEGIVKLGDFGLGRFFSQNTRDAHTLVGTFYYMSPERISGHGYDFSSDIWSLGCVLYELITLYSPFDITNVPPETDSLSLAQNQNQAIAPKMQNNGPTTINNNNNNNNPYSLQYLCDRIMRADYPSLADYNQVSLRLRQLATECLNPQPDQRPNMEYICQVVGETQRAQLTATQTKTMTGKAQTPRPIVCNTNQQVLQ